MRLFAVLRTSRSFLISTLIPIFLLFYTDFSYSQSSLKIYGQVIDSNGPVAGVLVELDNTTHIATTNHNGYYYFYDIPAGEYKLHCRFKDINTSTADRIIVAGGPPVRRDMFLENSLINTAPVYSDVYPLSIANRHNLNVKVYDIADEDNNTIESIIKDIPGLNLIESNATGEIYISAGGIKSDGVNILVDGRKINSLLTGRADLSQIPLKAIRKIEHYLPGAAQTSTGGGLSGTVNFVTESGRLTNSAEAAVAHGSFYHEMYSLGADYNKIRYGDIHALWERNLARNNYKYIDYYGNPDIRRNALIKQSKYYLSYSNSIAGNFIRCSGYIFDGENGVPGQIINLKDYAYSNKNTISFGGELSRSIDEKIQQKLLLSFLGRNTTYNDSGSLSYYDTEFKEREYGISLSSNYHFNRRFGFTTSISFTTSVLEGIDYLRPQKALGEIWRNVYVLYGAVNYTKKINKLSLAMNFSQAENIVDNKSYSTSSLSSSLAYTSGVTFGIKSTLARSFRLPGLAELNWQEDVFVLPNPDLKPEKSRSISSELYSNVNFMGNWRFSLEYRDIRYKDLIYWRRSQGIKYKPVNVSASDFFSATAAMKWEIPHDLAEINFSRESSYPVNREDGLDLYGKYIIHQPLYLNRLGIKFTYRKFRFRANMLDSGRRYITEVNTKSLKPYTLVDISAGFSHRIKNIKTILELRINNLTDIKYELLEYQPMPPRNYNLILTLKI